MATYVDKLRKDEEEEKRKRQAAARARMEARAPVSLAKRRAVVRAEDEEKRRVTTVIPKAKPRVKTSVAAPREAGKRAAAPVFMRQFADGTRKPDERFPDYQPTKGLANPVTRVPPRPVGFTPAVKWGNAAEKTPVKNPARDAKLNGELTLEHEGSDKTELDKETDYKKSKPYKYTTDGKLKNGKEMSNLDVMAWLLRDAPKEKRAMYTEQFITDMKAPGNHRYDPYYRPTSNNDEARSLFGQDTFDRTFFDEARSTYGLLEWNDAHTSILAPTKKGARSTLQYAKAYKAYQMETKDEPTTLAAEEDLRALREDIALRAAAGTTADDIYNSIDWSEYPGIEKLHKAKADYGYTLLNRPVYAGKESIMAVINATLRGEDVTEDKDYLRAEAGYLASLNEQYSKQHNREERERAAYMEEPRTRTLDSKQGEVHLRERMADNLHAVEERGAPALAGLAATTLKGLGVGRAQTQANAIAAADPEGTILDELLTRQTDMTDRATKFIKTYEATDLAKIPAAIQTRIADLTGKEQQLIEARAAVDEKMELSRSMGFEPRPEDRAQFDDLTAEIDDVRGERDQAKIDTDVAEQLAIDMAKVAASVAAAQPKTRLQVALEAEQAKISPLDRTGFTASDASKKVYRCETHRLQLTNDEWTELLEKNLSYEDFNAAVEQKTQENLRNGGVAYLRYQQMSAEERVAESEKNLVRASETAQKLRDMQGIVGSDPFIAYAAAMDQYQQAVNASAEQQTPAAFAREDDAARLVLRDFGNAGLEEDYRLWDAMGRPDASALQNNIDLYAQYAHVEKINPGIGDLLLDGMTGGQWSSSKYNPGVGFGRTALSAIGVGASQFLKAFPLIGTLIAQGGHAVSDLFTGDVESYKNDPFYLACQNGVNELNRRIQNQQQYMAENATGIEGMGFLAGTEATEMAAFMMTGHGLATASGVSGALNSLHSVQTANKLLRSYSTLVSLPQSVTQGAEETNAMLAAGEGFFESLAYGALKSLIEVSTECDVTDKLLGRVFGRGITEDVLLAGSKKAASLGSAAIGWATDSIAGMNQEGMQEVLSEIGGIGADIAVFGKTEGTSPQELLEAYWGGFSTSLLMQTFTMPQAANSYRYARQLQAQHAAMTPDQWVALYDAYRGDMLDPDIAQAVENAGAASEAIDRDASIEDGVQRAISSGEGNTPDVKTAERALANADQQIEKINGDLSRIDEERQKAQDAAADQLSQVAAGQASAVDALPFVEKLRVRMDDAAARHQQATKAKALLEAERRKSAGELAVRRAAAESGIRQEIVRNVDRQMAQARQSVETVNALVRKAEDGDMRDTPEAAQAKVTAFRQIVEQALEKLDGSPYARWVWEKTGAKKMLAQLEATRQGGIAREGAPTELETMPSVGGVRGAAGVPTGGGQTPADAPKTAVAGVQAGTVGASGLASPDAAGTAPKLPEGHAYDATYHDKLKATADALPDEMPIEEAVKAFGRDLSGASNIDRWLHGLEKRAKKTGNTAVTKADVLGFIEAERASDQENMPARVAFEEKLMRHEPVDVISAPSIAETKRGEHERVKEWAKRLLSTFTGTSNSSEVKTLDGVTVTINRDTVEESFQHAVKEHNVQKTMAAVPILDKLLKNGVYIGSHYDYSESDVPSSPYDIRAMHYYIAASKIDGQSIRVIMTVKTSHPDTYRGKGDVSNRLYLERVEIIGASSALSQQPRSIGSPLTANSGSSDASTTLSISNLLAGVNLNRMKIFDGPPRARAAQVGDAKLTGTPRVKPADSTLAMRAEAMPAALSAAPEEPEFDPTKMTHGKVKRASEIGKTLYKALDVVKTSRYQPMDVRSGNALGMFERHSGVVVTRSRQDISTLAHELGHALFARAGAFDEMNPTPAYAEDFRAMRKNLPESFVQVYVNAGRANQLYHEAGAEFVRNYLTDRNAAVGFAGDSFVRRFESEILNRAQLRAMQRARVEISNLLTAESLDRNRAMNVSGRDSPKNRQYFSQLLTGVFDKYHSFLRIDKAARKAGYDNTDAGNRLYTYFSNLPYAADRAGNILTGMLTAPDGRVVAGSMADIMKGIRARDAQDFNTYLTLKHDPDRQAQGKPVYAGQSAEQSRINLHILEAQHPEFARVQKDLMTWWNAFLDEWVVKPNAIPNAQETVERFRTMYPNYVPTLRSNADDTDMMRETFGDMGGALQSASVHFKHATGSDKAIKSPIESMAIRVQEIVSATDKVLAMRKFHEVMQAVPGLGEFAREVSAPSSVEIRSAKEAIFDAEREAHNAKRALSHATQRGDSEQISSAGIRVEGATQGLANARGALERMQSVNTDELTHILDASGKEHFYQITDKVLFDVLQGKPHEVEGVLRLVGRVTGVFKKLTTANNPFFAVSNMLRDYVEAYTKGSAWTPVDFTIDWAKALGELTREAVTGKATARLTQYRAAGGGDASISPNTNPGVAAMEQALYGDYIKDSLAKIARGRDFKERLRGPVDGLRGLGRSLTSAIGAANNVIEGSQRYAEFSRQVRKGANTTDAFRAGMDVTTDFRRSGNAYSVKAAGNVFAFMNAGLQGTYSMYRMVQEGKFDQKQLAGRIAKSLAMYAVLPVLIRTLIRGDDEDEQAYQLMAENVKRNNYLIPKSWVGGKKGEFFKWALPNGPLPATGDAFGRALVESIEHEGGLDAWVQYGLGDYAKETLGELVESINPFSSPIYAPISQLMQNRTWYDAPIVPEWMRSEHISKSQQVTDATSSVGIFFANLPGLKDNVSPIQVDYLINQSFGVLGDLALSDAGDALTAKLQGDGAWLGVFKAAGKTVGDMFASRINTNPTIASDMTSAMYAAMDTLGGIAADMDKDGFSNALNEHLTLAERTEAARLADKACKRGGVLYAAKKNNAAAYKTLDALMAGSGDAEEKALRARSIKFKILMENAAAVRYYEEYMKQYVKGTPAQYRARARAKAS